MRVCVCVCVLSERACGGQRSTWGALLTLAPSCFLRQGISQSLELADSSRLSKQWAWGIHPSLPIQPSIRAGALHWPFAGMLGNLISGSSVFTLATSSTSRLSYLLCPKTQLTFFKSSWFYPVCVHALPTCTYFHHMHAHASRGHRRWL